MKLTMVSIVVKGRRYTTFVKVKPDGDGKVRVDESDLPGPKMARGTTYTPGG